MPSQTTRLRRMMAPYEGPGHRVVAFALHRDASQTILAGAEMPGVPCEDLIFEIGSITKVFTAILLCLLVEEGKIDPAAPLREISDDLHDVPDWITPARLTSHTSGLPRIHVPIWKALIHPLPADPYAEFSRADLFDWIRTWPGTDPGSKRRHAYSNLGVGLLGEAMALCEGQPFVDLLADRILRPLALRDTTSRLDAQQTARFMQPRTTRGAPVPPWTFDAMAAAGCLRSTAGDLARFSRAVLRALEGAETPLDRAICRSAVPIVGLGFRGNPDRSAQCAGWLSWRPDSQSPRLIYHDGGTAGSTCAICLCPEKSGALAVLSNNGVSANLRAAARLSWSNPLRQAQDHFAAL
ncbi:serine hydrolase domain-containing protein [Pseudooceanicola aestuarii]|uniref:serine hydrolase domain-containing protein n=1 Tax=Pseudooceanicola aestuarii TaxID=2697319 RepID=UPI0013D14073|nr:serine hydrolase domain-containing protein [Pseudooceanicola aestuarii]